MTHMMWMYTTLTEHPENVIICENGDDEGKFILFDIIKT